MKPLTPRQFLFMCIVAIVAGCILGALAREAEGHVVAKSNIGRSGVPDDEVAILRGYYADAAKRLKKIVLNPPGTKASSQQFNQARAALQLQQVERELRELGKWQGLWVGKNLPQAYRDGIDVGLAQLDEAGVRPEGNLLAGSFSQVDRDSVIVLAQDTLADLTRAKDSMGETARFVLRRSAQEGLSGADINTILARGVIEGKPREAIRELADALRAVHGEKVIVTDKNGEPMEFDAGYYASMVARTKTREAMVKGQHNRLEQAGVDLVAIVGRISENFCTAFVGQVFSLSGNHAKYPAYDSLPGGGPPFHPNCSKGTRPFIESLATNQQLERAEGVEDAEKLLGKDTSRAQRMFKDLQLHEQVVATVKKRSA